MSKLSKTLLTAVLALSFVELGAVPNCELITESDDCYKACKE